MEVKSTVTEAYIQSPLFTTEKRCTRCGETQPVDAFYLRQGYRAVRCKKCTNVVAVARYKVNPEPARARALQQYKRLRASGVPRKRKPGPPRPPRAKPVKIPKPPKPPKPPRPSRPETPPGMKRCPDCGETKPHASFPRKPSATSGVADYCSPCNRKQRREYYERHPQRRAMDRERRRARENETKVSDLTLAQWQDMLVHFNGHCAYCNRPFMKLNQEHVIPLSRGGNHTASNIVPACRSCNSRKGRRTLMEWLLAGTVP